MSDVAWRQPPLCTQHLRHQPRIQVARWQSFATGVQQVSADTQDDTHVIAVALRRMDARLTVAGRTLVDGVLMPGMHSITAPGAPVTGLFRGSYDVLHLHVPNDLMTECRVDLAGPEGMRLESQVTSRPDPIVEALGLALLGASQMDGFEPLYAESVGIALVARVIASSGEAASSVKQPVAPLQKWRLKRVMEYVDANLAKPVSLADLATATGLTRMHFAAQFRAATGLRPHEYLLRRRVERAQELLAGSMRPVVDIALDVGFQSQAHFTSVFKRFAGRPPQTWRHCNNNAG
jgi:AraC family transcriptional regulator